ncbi:arf-GAP with Rho-GAP domain, ANK repeat and PH domain-containing protein 2-like [Heteronotia binoei]|uniref:arf-GAP with Rho-GAP domain, ANK repeat and PH domain-containing protein 2-like n=1 Tax=Heteronotia binoei TaxID=13085 RepID=UPI00292F84A6|nr:arf-GAP with Rho-GAP domain, ANK repeat and PH domain-containing protein 2-like [Heteronotia binoei]
MKPEKVLPVKSLKLYLGVKKKMKPPTNWGVTLCSEKHHWYLCCDGRDSQLEWLSSLFIAQHSNIWPPDGKIRKRSTRKNPTAGGLSLIPIQHERSPQKTKVNNLENSKLEPEGEPAEDKKGLKQKVSLVAQCLELNGDRARSRERKHRSLNFLENAGENAVDLHQNPDKESKSPKRSENKADQLPLESSDKQLPANVIQELSTILQKHKSFHKET